jgi:MoaA/NifB/PqqE/SkfB family radical SAM enzyme
MDEQPAQTQTDPPGRSSPTDADLDEFAMPPPVHVNLEVTARCNLQCPMCAIHATTPHADFAHTDMKLEVVDLLGRSIHAAETVLLTGGGEPLLLRDFTSFIHRVREYNPGAKITFISNGTTMTERQAHMVIEKGIHSIEFSMDGTIQYGHVGGGADYARVKDNLRRLALLKQEAGVEEPHMVITFVAMRDNLVELPDLLEFAGEIGAAGVMVQPISPSFWSHQDQNIFRHVDYARQVLHKCSAMAKEIGVPLDVRNMDFDMSDTPKECLVPFNEVWVSHDGRLKPCCGGIESMGSVYGEGLLLKKDFVFQEFWNGPEIKRLRWELRTGNYRDTCRRCPILWNSPEQGLIALSEEEDIAQLREQVDQLTAYVEQMQSGRKWMASPPVSVRRLRESPAKNWVERIAKAFRILKRGGGRALWEETEQYIRWKQR